MPLAACEKLCEEFCEKDDDPPAPTLADISVLDGTWRGTQQDGPIMLLRLLRGRVVGFGYPSEPFLIHTATYNGTFAINGEEFTAEIRAYGRDESSSAYVRQATFFASGTVAPDESMTITYTDLSGVDRSMDLTPYTDTQFPIVQPASIESLKGLWSQTSNDNPVESLNMMGDGSFFGQNANGCTYEGTGTVIDPDYNLYEVALEVSACAAPTANGNYVGYAMLNHPRVGEPSGLLLMVIFGGTGATADRDYAITKVYRRED